MHLFVSDLDGTLLTSQKEITPRTIDVINRAVKAGAAFTIATARSLTSVLELVKELDINAPMVLMNGAFVFDPRLEEYIKYETIPHDFALEIASILASHTNRARMICYDHNKIVHFTQASKDEKAVGDERDCQYSQVVHTDSLLEHLDICPVIGFVIVDSFAHLSPIYRELRENKLLYCCLYEDVYNEGVFWLEIFSHTVSKAHALKFVKNYLGASKLLVFGDNLNDIEMFSLADESYCVANGIRPAKDAAAHLLRHTNNEDAVARVISSLALGEEFLDGNDLVVSN